MHVRLPENCQKSIPKPWCSPIQGTISSFLLNYGTNQSPCFYTFQDIVSQIGEHWDFGMYFCQFSKHPDILVIPGKFLELRSNVQFFFNPGDNVMISADILCSQDLRLQHICFFCCFFNKVVQLVNGGSVINPVQFLRQNLVEICGPKGDQILFSFYYKFQLPNGTIIVSII